MIRPSALNIARHCRLSPVLAERFPSKNENTERGNVVDAQVTAFINERVVPTDRDALACIEWLALQFPASEWTLRAQVRVELRDPDTGGLITAGTLDIVAIEIMHDGDQGATIIVDLKKREQYAAGRLAEPDDNDQLHAYALASVAPGAAYRTCLLLFGDGQVEPLWSKIYTAATWEPVLERIRAVNEPTEGEPRPTSGPHCSRCYSRAHCPSWALPAHAGPTELEPLTQPGGLTRDNAGRALMAVMAMEEMADRAREALKAFVAEHGPIEVGGRSWGPVWMPGRASVDARALEQDGLLERYSKVGRPYQQFRIGKTAAK